MALLRADRLRPTGRRKSHHTPESDAANRLRKQVQSMPLLVPRVDWPDVLAGVKTEWRRYGAAMGEAGCPRPVILYSIAKATGEVETRLAILEATWREPMGAISPESLEREGFADLGEFRRYIDARHPNGGFRPMAQARVYRVRLVTGGDLEWVAAWSAYSLFGELSQ